MHKVPGQDWLSDAWMRLEVIVLMHTVIRLIDQDIKLPTTECAV